MAVQSNGPVELGERKLVAVGACNNSKKMELLAVIKNLRYYRCCAAVQRSKLKI